MAIFHGYLVDPRLVSIFYLGLSRGGFYKEDYADSTDTSRQEASFLNGFYDVIDRRALKGYSQVELEQLFGGINTLQK